MMQFIAALIQAELLKIPHYEFTSHSYRFQKRFEVFGSLPQPPQLTYEDFLQGSDFSNVTPADLISSASDCFKSAKVIVDKLLGEIGAKFDGKISSPVRKEEVMKFAKVCVGNTLFLHKLRQLVEKNRPGCKITEKSVTFDFGVHEQFCTIKVN